MHLGVTAPAFAVDDLLIREHRAARIAPVDRRFLLVGEPLLVEKLKEPLRPAVVLGTTGHSLAAPIVGKPHAHLLALHVLNVGICPIGGLHTVLDRSVLRRHAKGVKAHRVQHIAALHLLEARDDVADRIIAHMTHVQIARRVGEHLQHIIFRLRAIDLRLVDVILLPLLLPLFFDFLRSISLHTTKSS